MTGRGAEGRAERGRWAEQLASRHLTERGLHPITANYRCPRGELDLIMRDGDTLVFVEVRYRRGTSHGGALESVDGAKRTRITRTAEHYLSRHGGSSPPPCRFDVVAVSGDPQGARVEWIPGAFEA